MTDDPHREVTRMSLLRYVAAVLVLLGVWHTPLAPAPALTLKLTTLDLEHDPLSEPLKWWMKTVSERTANRVQFQPFWGQSLVPLPRTMSAVKSGIADAGYFVTATLSGEEKDFAILEVHGALPTDERYAQAWLAIEPVMTRILDRHDVVLMWPRRSPKAPIACKQKFLKEATDYRGLKVRAAGRWEIASINKMGASGFAIPPAETYTALQRGTVDCTYHIYPLLWALKLYEVAPHVTRIDDSASFNFIGVNKRTWSQIGEADRTAILEISRDAMRREMDTLKRREETIIEDLAKQGVQFFTPPPAELKRITEAVKPLWQEARQAMGPDGQKLADLLEPFQVRH
jgi:TRAP-type C4-dicarboxylate transport system substrate-binding protein